MSIRSSSGSSADQARRAREAERQRAAEAARRAAQEAAERAAHQATMAVQQRTARDAEAQNAARAAFSQQGACSAERLSTSAPSSTRSSEPRRGLGGNAGSGSAKPEKPEKQGGIGGLFSKIKDATIDKAADVVGDVVGGVGERALGVGATALGIGTRALDVAGDAVDAGRRAASQVAHVAEQGTQLAVDVARGTVDAVGDAAEAGVDGLRNAATFAAKNGFALGSRSLGRLHAAEQGALDSALNVGQRIDALQPGDDFTLNAGGSFAVGLGVGIDNEVKIKREDDGRYTVSSAADARITAGLGKTLGASAGLDGRASYSFDNAADARRAALVLGVQQVGTMAGALSGNPVGQVVGQLAATPLPDDAAFLRKHLSSVEVDVGLGGSAGFAERIGTTAAGAKGSLEFEGGARVEFADGKPVAVVRTQRAMLDGTGGSAMLESTFSAEQMSREPYKSAREANMGSGTLVIETRLPVDGNHAIDELVRAASAPLPTGATSKITLSGEAQNGADGVKGEVVVDGVDQADVARILDRARDRDFAHLFDGLAPVRRGWTFRESGPDVDINFIVGGVRVGAVARDVTPAD
jgi:hypothetical protein